MVPSVYVRLHIVNFFVTQPLEGYCCLGEYRIISKGKKRKEGF